MVIKSGTDFADLTELTLELVDAPNGSLRKKIIKNITGIYTYLSHIMPQFDLSINSRTFKGKHYLTSEEPPSLVEENTIKEIVGKVPAGEDIIVGYFAGKFDTGEHTLRDGEVCPFASMPH